jgi:hypothetical protein
MKELITISGLITWIIGTTIKDEAYNLLGIGLMLLSLLWPLLEKLETKIQSQSNADTGRHTNRPQHAENHPTTHNDIGQKINRRNSPDEI